MHFTDGPETKVKCTDASGKPVKLECVIIYSYPVSTSYRWFHDGDELKHDVNDPGLSFEDNGQVMIIENGSYTGNFTCVGVNGHPGAMCVQPYQLISPGKYL